MSESVTGWKGNKKAFENNKRNKGPQDGQAKDSGSKYAKKHKGKGKQKPAPAPVNRQDPVNDYLCLCHDVKATKTPCERNADDRRDRKYSESPLGTWRCSVSNRKCNVRVKKHKAEESNEAAA